ncbi:GerMN domain-containing protein [Paenibacillus polysaccharolyticus]|uniref:GerMN domain-containing protein n=1 Tax=Paenibacillus polysaccharolyticus TaxID=582692 RepID=UPI00203C3001|nr:GerMN domain-containing protein [Paenibacillus polysaccharolyticus]MCM3133219.1 GerMN domain-containing protein [Paenibacillus polysaccharolyticus]
MNKKVWIAALLVTVMAVAAGCGSKPTAAPNQTQGAGSETQTGNGVTEVEGQVITDPATAGSEDNTTPSNSANGSSEGTTSSGGASSGEASTDKPSTSDSKETKSIEVFYTDPEELELHKASADITFASEDDKYKEAFASLQQSKDEKLVPLWSKDIELKSVQFKDGALTLDIHMPDTARLGAGGESFAIDALKQTFFQFDEVKSLDLLVDGKSTESLMGHVDLEHPMTRSN